MPSRCLRRNRPEDEFRIIALIAALASVTAGCVGGSTDSIMIKSTMTKDEALDRVQELINDTVSIIDPKPRLDLDPITLTVYPCLGWTGDHTDGRIFISRAYHLRGLPKEKDKLADIARSVRRHWEQRGHIIEAVSRDGLVITARSRSDDFRLSLSWTSGDIPGLGVSSPCVWPKGTPEPIPSSDLDRLSESRQTP